MKVDTLSLYKIYSKRLRNHYPNSEAQSMVRILLEKITGHSVHQILANPDISLNKKQIEDMEHYLSLLKLQKPIQYILGEAHFFDNVFRVTPDVLIPRPETEELVNWVLFSNGHERFNVLDIGTGSGCIGISLALNRTQWSVYATDVSVSALSVAKENAFNLNANVTFFEHNILTQTLQFAEISKFDIIVSNPPYVRQSEALIMNSNVLDNEPKLALFVPDNDALLFYRAIAQKAKGSLSINGSVFCEINEALGDETAKLFKDYGYTNVDVRKDINGKDRMLKADI